MSQNNNAILSITLDGNQPKVKINTPEGASFSTNSTKTYMQNIEQNSTGGQISHNANNLTQIGGSQTAKNKGEIINKVEGGTLQQENLSQLAEDKGKIANIVKKN